MMTGCTPQLKLRKYIKPDAPPRGSASSVMARGTRRVVLRNSLLGAYVTEHIQLLLISSSVCLLLISLRGGNKRVFWCWATSLRVMLRQMDARAVLDSHINSVFRSILCSDSRTRIDMLVNTQPVNWRRWATPTWRTIPKKASRMDGSRISGGEGCLEKRLGSHPGG